MSVESSERLLTELLEDDADSRLWGQDSLDFYEGGLRPEGARLTVDQLPPLSDVQRKRFWMWKFSKGDLDIMMNVKQARVFLENELTRLVGILKRGRVHPPRDCYFVFPMDRKQKE